MYVCIYVCMCVCITMCRYAHLYIHMWCVCGNVCLNLYENSTVYMYLVYVYLCVCACVDIYIYMIIYIYICVCVLYIRASVCAYISLHTYTYMYRLVCALKHPCVCMSGLESRPVHPQICLPIYLPTNDPPIFHLIPIYCIYLSPGLHIHPSISILNDSHLCPCKRRDCSRFVASSCLTCSESLPCKTSKKKAGTVQHQERVGAILVALVDAQLRRTSLLFTPHWARQRRSFAARNPEDLSRKPSGRGRNPHWHPTGQDVSWMFYVSEGLWLSHQPNFAWIM